MDPHLPKKALKFLRWFCRKDFVEEIEGDLTEMFIKEYDQSPRKAKRRFVWRVIRCFRPAFMKSFKHDHTTNPTDMFRHNFLITLRNFNRHRTSFVINLTGLTSGLVCTLMIYLWVMDELHIDKFNEKDSHLFQVMQNFPDASGIHTGEGTQGPLAAALAQEMPEVEYATTVVPSYWFQSKGIITAGETHLKASPQFISKDYFNVFTGKIIHGDKNNLLPDKTSLIISDELANRLFHTTENLIGKIVQWNHADMSDTYHITGVFEQFPSNATVRPDLLFNFEMFQSRRELMSWNNSDPSTFIILRAGTDVTAFNKKISGFIKGKVPKAKNILFVRPFSDKYLYDNYENGVLMGGRIFYVQLLSFTGLFIIVIACINFMNLSTAKATRRIKEVGIKKAIGASRIALILQYFSESGLVTALSLLLAIGITYILLPSFNSVTGKNLFIHFDPQLLISAGFIFLVTSLLAGSYPALYLSGFSPAAVLKGKISSSIVELFARRGLVVFQFSISVILIVAVLVVYKQMEYIRNKNLGYKKENIITFEMEGQPLEKLESFHAEIKKVPGVINAGTYYHNLTGSHGSIELEWEGKTPDQRQDFANLEVGYDFIETMDIQFKAGHSFSKDKKPESQIILNQAAIDIMGLKDPVGKTIRFWGTEREIVGVTANFNFESLHESVKPGFFQVYPVMFNFVVKVQGGAEKETIARIQSLYNTYAAGYPFDYKFLDDNYQSLYASEERVAVLSRYFATIAIIISCLGLFGLASFTAEKRLKEIGIRKVLGASVTGIVYLLSADFTKIVLTSIFIALPVSYFLTKRWIDGFAFRIELECWYFIAAGSSALLIAWLTICIQTLKAARVNPTQSLKAE